MNILMLVVAGVLLFCADDWKSFALGALAGWLAL